jgi:hypothetical protein
MFAPAAAAAVMMRMFVSKEGLKGSLGPARAWRSYALAVLLGLVVVNLPPVGDCRDSSLAARSRRAENYGHALTRSFQSGRLSGLVHTGFVPFDVRRLDR